MEELEQQANSIDARYTRAQDRLSNVRAQVLLGSVYVRDALLDPDPASADTYRRQLERTYREADRSLERYEMVWNSDAERERVARLRRELGDFRATVLGVLATESRQWPTQARLILRDQIVPKREGVIRVSEEVQAMNRATLLQQQRATADVYRATQRVMWERLGFGVAGSLAIALLAAFYAGRLEDRIRRQRARDIQNTRDVERLSMKLLSAQEAECRNLARELHDEVGQALTAISVELAVAQRTIDEMSGPPGLLDDARSATDGTLQAVRDVSRLLHPAILDDLGLRAAIEDFVRRFARRHSTHVELVMDDSEHRFAPDLESAAYRTVQEALTNVSRHARASTCRVTVHWDDRAVHLTIDDDGIGFDVAGTDSAGTRRGLGLISIRERVSQAGGRVVIDSRIGHGTLLKVVLPVRLRAARDDQAFGATDEKGLALTTPVPAR